MGSFPFLSFADHSFVPGNNISAASPPPEAAWDDGRTSPAAPAVHAAAPGPAASKWAAFLPAAAPDSEDADAGEATAKSGGARLFTDRAAIKRAAREFDPKPVRSNPPRPPEARTHHPYRRSWSEESDAPPRGPSTKRPHVVQDALRPDRDNYAAAEDQDDSWWLPATASVPAVALEAPAAAASPATTAAETAGKKPSRWAAFVTSAQP
jgi:hypothetical protein